MPRNVIRRSVELEHGMEVILRNDKDLSSPGHAVVAVIGDADALQLTIRLIWDAVAARASAAGASSSSSSGATALGPLVPWVDPATSGKGKGKGKGKASNERVTRSRSRNPGKGTGKTRIGDADAVLVLAPPLTHADIDALLPDEDAPINDEKAKWQILRALRVLHKHPKPVRAKGFRLLALRYHPDKLGREIGDPAFKFLMDGRPSLFLD